MTQEEKQLLLIDLCSRLPYKVMGHATWTYLETDREVKYAEKDRPIEINDLYAVWDFKPYLRPMSSMTEEEKEIYRCLSVTRSEKDLVIPSPLAMQWLLSRYFDINHLIENELALEAPEGMYK